MNLLKGMKTYAGVINASIRRGAKAFFITLAINVAAVMLICWLFTDSYVIWTGIIIGLSTIVNIGVLSASAGIREVVNNIYGLEG